MLHVFLCLPVFHSCNHIIAKILNSFLIFILAQPFSMLEYDLRNCMTFEVNLCKYNLYKISHTHRVYTQFDEF